MGAGAAGASEQRLPVCRRFEVLRMHMVIYALVEASAHDDSLATGKTVFDRLIGADPHAGAVFVRSQRNSQIRSASPTFKYETGNTRERTDGR
jgi:hypothetical protein